MKKRYAAIGSDGTPMTKAKIVRKTIPIPMSGATFIVPPGTWSNAVIFIDDDGVAKMAFDLPAKKPTKKRTK